MLVVKYERPEYIKNANGKSHFYTQFYLDKFQPKPYIGHVLFGASKIPCDYKVDGNTNKVIGDPQPCLQKIGHSASMYRPEEAEAEFQTKREIHFSVAAFFNRDRTIELLAEHTNDFPEAEEQFTKICDEIDEAFQTYNKHTLFLLQTHMLAFLRSLYGEIPLQKFYAMHVSDVMQHVRQIFVDGATALARRSYTRKAPTCAVSAPDILANIDDASTSTGGDEADGGGGSMTGDDDYPVLALDFKQLLALYRAQTERDANNAKNEIAQSAKQVQTFLWGNGTNNNNNNGERTRRKQEAICIRDPNINNTILASYDPTQILLKPFNTHTLSSDDWCVLLVYSILWSAFDSLKHFFLDIDDIIRARNNIQIHFICDTNDIVQALETLVLQKKVVLSCGIAACVEPSKVKPVLLEILEKRKKGHPAASPNISLAVHYHQEETVFRKLDSLLKAPKHIDKGQHDSASQEIANFLAGSDISLDDAQKKAMECYASHNLLTLQGRGGTGKTFLTVIMAYYARLYDGQKPIYLFTGFTNNSVNGLRTAIMQHPLNYNKIMTTKNCYFVTMDHILHKYIHNNTSERDTPRFTRVFIDEAAMASTRNFFAALSIIDPATTTVMMDGDPNQLEAISAGSNFSDISSHLREPHSIHLQYIHRTSQLALKTALDAILHGNKDGMLDDTTAEHSFQTRYSYPDVANFRTEACLAATARICWETLCEIDPQRTKYCQTQLLCPFRIHVAILNKCCQAYYTLQTTQLSSETISDWVRETMDAVSESAGHRQYQKHARPHELRVGSKIVFRVTNKNDKYRRKDNTYCNGTSGYITEMYDVDKTATPQEYDPAAEDRVKSTLQDIGHNKKRVLVVDSTFVVEYTSNMELNSILQPGDAITVDKSQCQEYDTVLCFFPYSDRILAERNRLYTACSRAKNQCYLIISRPQLQSMLRNGKTPSNSNLRLWLSSWQQNNK